MRSILILLTVAPFIFMSCGTTNNKTMTDKNAVSGQNIANDYWVLETLNNEQITHPKDPREIGFKLNSDENRISGFGGCNNFMGSYTLTDSNKIEFSKIASTKMACLQSTFDERLLFEALENADSYTISENRLTLKRGNNGIATFKKSAEQEKNEVVEKYWKLKTLDGENVTMSENQEREIHFILKSDDKTISGYDGCNSFSGEFELNDNNQFTTYRMRSTLRVCPDSDFDESKFNALFIGPITYEIKGDTLTVSNSTNKSQAVFEAIYFN